MKNKYRPSKKENRLERKKISKLSTFLLIVLMLLTMFPFYIMIVGAVKPAISLVTFPMDLNPTTNLTLDNIIKVLKKSDVFLWLKNSFVVSLSVAALTCFVSVTAGYAFARFEFKGKKFLFMCVMATLMMPKQVLLIPNYLVAQKLGLVNTMIGLILTSIAPASGVFLCRQFISTLPRELFEAAEMDGCGEIRKFCKIALPLTMPAIGTTAIFAFFGTFNDYLWQLVMISDKNLKTLPIGVTMFAQTQQGNKAVQLAMALIATVPLVILFLLCQKFFIGNSTEGSVKG
jgi:ABC-type glycerol-3-phosphate transport system permease component